MASARLTSERPLTSCTAKPQTGHSLQMGSHQYQLERSCHFPANGVVLCPCSVSVFRFHRLELLKPNLFQDCLNTCADLILTIMAHQKLEKKKQPVSNRNLSTETHMGMPHAEMIVELFIVDKEVLN